MELLEAQPDAKEIQVERVKFLRYGEARGDYDQVVAALNARGPARQVTGARDKAASHRRISPPGPLCPVYSPLWT